MSISVRVLFFALIREKTEKHEILIKLPNTATVYDLRLALAGRYPGIRELLLSSLVAVNQNYAGDQDVLTSDAEVAIFPRVSGGDDSCQFPTLCKIQTKDIGIEELLEGITQRTTGAICMFTGVVRAFSRRGKLGTTEYLEYDAYIPMAEAKILQIAREIREKWPSVEGIVIVQRIGKVNAGENSVIVACAAAHRDTGVFDAARYGIDRLKEIVPVWKQETGQQGKLWIEGEYKPDPGE